MFSSERTHQTLLLSLKRCAILNVIDTHPLSTQHHENVMLKAKAKRQVPGMH